ncbi:MULTISPECIES: branched-chain amino acid ABC transporter permease [Thalassobaculum]|uniref:Amino acid/amide ABC transporter membrane protein 1, HAAT family (TC 3.A.1.4.-) n=1 Tax=Thalassobaculum litoreum DSM 18839 TaxID=1123362 RepID=A0A8G2EWA5_9PROT|nr:MULTISPECIES: branched-chain amino acid ABC transporter permease [Thalassobaculum]SDG20715.1 amino acid/amide ABC transporter membrane protein 1, HAAT family (TC 3.A.1.4.-) [Thalassobaculum litoreum DSM 18839]
MIDNLLLLTQVPILGVDLVIQGLFIGAIFALVAYGLALVWGVMNVKNLAQGDMVILGGYISYQATLWGYHPIVALPVAIVVMFMLGWLIYAVIIRRVVDRDMFTSLLATFGLSLLIQQILNLIYGPEVKVADAGFGDFELGTFIVIQNVRLYSLLMAAALALAIVIFMKKSRMGQAIRATAQDARAARVLGIDTDQVYAFTYALNAAICGAAGVLVAMIWVIQPYYGIVYSIRAFIIVTAAGLGNLPGVILTGFGLGVWENVAGFVFGAEFAVAAVVLMLVAVLMYRLVQLYRVRQVVR